MHDLNTKSTPRNVSTRSARLARELFDTYRPQVLILEKTNYSGSRRSRCLPGMAAAFKRLARARGIEVVEYMPQEVKAALSPDGTRPTKPELCQALARRYPRLARYLPRKPQHASDGQPYYTNRFMAVALGLTWARQHLSRR